MKLPQPPDLTTPLRMALASIVVAIVVSLVLYSSASHWIPGALGDTDDATRMVMVRELLAGRGWWDQHFLRYQPPLGLYMHWSRLLDGGIAGLDLAFRLFLTPANAEIATRVAWPGLWVIPAVWASLAAARALAVGVGASDGGRNAVVAAMVVTAISLPLYTQFHPGRIDHHNAQIALTMLALAGVMQPQERKGWAYAAGLAAGLGNAVGLEALFFHGVIAGVCALRFATDPKAKPFVQAYATAFLFSTLVAFGVQTPPWRWTVMACDAIAANLVGGIVTGALGLILAMKLTWKRSFTARLSALTVAGLAAVSVFFGLHPACIHGPFADVDVRLRAIWLDNVTEVANLALHYTRDADQALSMGIACLAGALALIGLGLYRRQFHSPAWWALCLSIVLGLVVGWSAIRMTSYGAWFAVPAVAAAAGFVATRYQSALGVLAPIGAALVLAPVGWSGLASQLNTALTHKAPRAQPDTVAAGHANVAATTSARPRAKPPADFCFNAFAYKDLARAPAGLTLSEIDLGPFVVAYTPSSTLSAPYHRMEWGIMAARNVLTSDADHALPMINRLGVTYVLECPHHSNHLDRVKLGKQALQYRLDHNDPPPWLTRLSDLTSPVIVYRVAAPKTQ